MALLEIVHDIEGGLYYGHDDHLCETIQRVQCEGRVAPVPGGYKELSLIIGVDQPHEIAHHDAMFVP